MRAHIFIFISLLTLLLAGFFIARNATPPTTVQNATISQATTTPTPDQNTPDTISRTPLPPVESPSQPTRQESLQRVTVLIDTTTLSVPLATEQSVMDVMETARTLRLLDFTSKEYPGMGRFIESINGRKGADGLYWILYINNTSSDVGASAALVRPGDVIEWKFTKGY